MALDSFNQTNLIPQEVGLADLLNIHEKRIKYGLNCHHIGTIEDFNELNQTATVSINYSKTFLTFDSTAGFSQTTFNYPNILQAPVIILGGGSGSLTFPIKSGDECLVIFNDRDIDHWFATSDANSPTDTPRLHSFSDALVLIGVNSFENWIVGYDTDAVALSNDSNFLKIYDDEIDLVVGDNSIEITEDSITQALADGNSTVLSEDGFEVSLAGGTSLELDSTGTLAVTNETGELLAVIYQLMLDIQAATASGFPLIMPTFTTDLAKLETFIS